MKGEYAGNQGRDADLDAVHRLEFDRVVLGEALHVAVSVHAHSLPAEQQQAMRQPQFEVLGKSGYVAVEILQVDGRAGDGLDIVIVVPQDGDSRRRHHRIEVSAQADPGRVLVVRDRRGGILGQIAAQDGGARIHDAGGSETDVDRGVSLHTNVAVQLRQAVHAVVGRRNLVVELLEVAAECEFVVRIQRADGQAGAKDEDAVADHMRLAREDVGIPGQAARQRGVIEQRAVPYAGGLVAVGVRRDGSQRRRLTARLVRSSKQPSRQAYSNQKSACPADHTPRFLLTVDAP